MPSFLSTSKSYIALPKTESFHSPPSHEEETEKQRQRARSRWILSFWVGTAVFFAALSALLGVRLHQMTSKGSFSKGFKYELAPAKHLIEIEERQFDGSPRFLDDGTEYVPEPDDGRPRPQYIGQPSRAIDHEWALLHWGRFFLLTEEEARDAWGPGYKDFWSPKHGGYVAALEVMHTLHCLDHLRKAYYPEIYPADSAIHGTMHRDHCLDHLRQMVMCNSDLTPIPSRYYIGIDQNYIDSSEQPHTCRNWPKVRDWVSARFNGSLAVPPAEGTVIDDEWH